jgi:hypothetical protein
VQLVQSVVGGMGLMVVVVAVCGEMGEMVTAPEKRRGKPSHKARLGADRRRTRTTTTTTTTTATVECRRTCARGLMTAGRGGTDIDCSGSDTQSPVEHTHILDVTRTGLTGDDGEEHDRIGIDRARKRTIELTTGNLASSRASSRAQDTNRYCCC